MDSQSLDGKTFYREFSVDPQWTHFPRKVFRHQVSFSDGKMRDNSNQFFGSPPSIPVSYHIEDDKVILDVDPDAEQPIIDSEPYTIVGPTIRNKSGAVLSLLIK